MLVTSKERTAWASTTTAKSTSRRAGLVRYAVVRQERLGNSPSTMTTRVVRGRSVAGTVFADSSAARAMTSLVMSVTTGTPLLAESST